MDIDAGMRWLRLLSGGGEVNPMPRLCVVVAHPDDEVIGAGSRLPLMRNAVFVHVTDGSPLNEADAVHAGCATRQDYAELRRREIEAALALAGIGASGLQPLGFIDQQASARMEEVMLALAAAFDELRPEVVLTHPYEGGHPDHDATAFAVHAAARCAARAPVILEMTSYHAGPAGIVTSEFLPPHDPAELTVALSEQDRAFKRELLRCFASQGRVLEQFSVDCERFRLAPYYDFTAPPHAGALYYEHHDWGMTGERWRALAADALARFVAQGVHQHA